jgi:hypothetical protein
MASGQSHDAPGLHATRQMIDELDALMERMLALPVNDTEDAPAPAPPTAPAPSSMPLTAKLTLLQVPADDPPLDSAHVGTNPSHLPVLGVVRSASAHPTTGLSPGMPMLPPLPEAPAVRVTPFSDRVVPPPMQPDLDTLLCEVPEPADSLGSWFIVLLFWGNRAFDQATTLLGTPGRLLRTSAARMALGLTGVILFVSACWWLLRDWFGW